MGKYRVTEDDLREGVTRNADDDFSAKSVGPFSTFFTEHLVCARQRMDF